MNMRQKINGWLSLVRLPNLFTIPGDVILGFIIAEACLENNDSLLGYVISKGEFANFAICYACASILSIYIFGLVTNDIVDFEEDRANRPDRPIPSGAVSKKEGWIFAVILLLSGLTFALLANFRVFVTVFILFILVSGYNFILKKHCILGPFTLAVCRVLSVITGFMASGINIDLFQPIVLLMRLLPSMFHVVCFTWLMYFFGISLIAYNETEKDAPVRGHFLIILTPALWLMTAPYASGALSVVLLMKELPPAVFLAIGSFVIFSVYVLKNFIILNLKSINPSKIQKCVGELIRSIIFLQASGCAFLGYPYIALVLFLIWLPAQFLNKKFYGS